MPPDASNHDAGPAILIVDDDPAQRSLLDSFLAGQGFHTIVVPSGERALEVLRSQTVDMMISDVRMPGLSGLETLRRARQLRGALPILLVTAHADIRDAVGAMRDGAVNYLAKPIDLDELLSSVRQAVGLSISAPVKYSGQKKLPPHLISASPLMEALFHDCALVAASESRVLITGESGVGKEAVADVIHAWSPRAAGPLVKLNCAAIPTGLLESEMFGHEKGAFTGAIAQRVGRFELAHRGTMFMDEVGEIPLELQTKLLRVLQEREFERLGSSRTIRTDARLVTATNRNLAEMVEQRQFRADLYYRLNVFPITAPALRQRREDIPLLVRYFVQQFARRMHKRITHIPAESMQVLERYAWPGNIRELQNFIERAVILSQGASLEAPVRELTRVPANAVTLADAERGAIERALGESGGKVGGENGAAARLGMKRTTLQAKMRKLGLNSRKP